MAKTQVRINKKCEHFKYHHCMATQSLHYCSVVQFCDMDADYCAKKAARKQ